MDINKKEDKLMGLVQIRRGYKCPNCKNYSLKIDLELEKNKDKNARYAAGINMDEYICSKCKLKKSKSSWW